MNDGICYMKSWRVVQSESNFSGEACNDVFVIECEWIDWRRFEQHFSEGWSLSARSWMIFPNPWSVLMVPPRVSSINFADICSGQTSNRCRSDRELYFFWRFFYCGVRFHYHLHFFSFTRSHVKLQFFWFCGRNQFSFVAGCWNPPGELWKFHLKYVLQSKRSAVPSLVVIKRWQHHE